MLELGSEEETLSTREMSSLWRSEPKERLKEGDLERETGEAPLGKTCVTCVPLYYLWHRNMHLLQVVNW